MFESQAFMVADWTITPLNGYINEVLDDSGASHPYSYLRGISSSTRFARTPAGATTAVFIAAYQPPPQENEKPEEPVLIDVFGDEIITRAQELSGSTIMKSIFTSQRKDILANAF